MSKPSTKLLSTEDQSISVDKNKLLDMTLVAADTEDNPVEFALESQPASGDLSNFDANQGTVTYEPSRDYVGQDRLYLQSNRR